MYNYSDCLNVNGIFCAWDIFCDNRYFIYIGCEQPKLPHMLGKTLSSARILPIQTFVLHSVSRFVSQSLFMAILGRFIFFIAHCEAEISRQKESVWQKVDVRTLKLDRNPVPVLDYSPYFLIMWGSIAQSGLLYSYRRIMQVHNNTRHET